MKLRYIIVSDGNKPARAYVRDIHSQVCEMDVMHLSATIERDYHGQTDDTRVPCLTNAGKRYDPDGREKLWLRCHKK